MASPSCALIELLFWSVVGFLSGVSAMSAGTPWKVSHDRGLSCHMTGVCLEPCGVKCQTFHFSCHNVLFELPE